MMFRSLGDNRWIVFVLPGFLALFTAGFVSDFPQIRDVLIPFVYVALTAVSVSIPLLATHFLAVARGRRVYLGDLHRNVWFVTSTFAFSVLIGLLFGMAHSTDAVSHAMRSWFGKNIILVSSHTETLRLLFREAYQPDFVDEYDGNPYIHDKERNVFVRLTYGNTEDVRVSHGVVHSYFGRVERPQVYLSPACKEETGNVVPIEGPGLWVNLDNLIEVEFQYQGCSSCAAALKRESGHGPLRTVCPFSADVDAGE